LGETGIASEIVFLKSATLFRRELIPDITFDDLLLFEI
jgi:hypothetical protein